MKSIRAKEIIILSIGLIIGIMLGCGVAPSTTKAEQQEAAVSAPPPAPAKAPIYEYAYAHGILETEGDAITLTIPELEKMDSDWGEIEVYKRIEFPLAFEGGYGGTEMYAINQIGEMGWELVCKYYVTDGYEKGHHYWFRREKK